LRGIGSRSDATHYAKAFLIENARERAYPY
jgi:hypothetical protein